MILAWDFDGVLVDTLKECHASYNAALADENLPGLSLDEFAVERKTAVQATDFFIQYFLRQKKRPYTKENLEKEYKENKKMILKLRENYHRERDGLLKRMFDQNPVYPGVENVLETLKEAKVRMAVVSARDDKSLHKYLKNKNLDGFFEYEIGSSSFFAPSHELKPLQLESLGKQEVYFVDDMPAVLFSLRGHARLFYAAWGYGVLPSEAEGVTVLKKPTDVLEYVL